mgnify:CR=1 FL=1
MKKTLLVVALLVGVSAASADINLFFSSTGMSDALKYSTALTNFVPGFAAPTPIGATLDEGSYDLFLWGQFVGQNDYDQIYGLQLQIEGSAAYDANKSVIYRQNKGAPNAYKRWDGALPVYVHNGVMAAVTAQGIFNWTATDPQPNDLVVRPSGSEGTKFLLGVVRVEGATAGQNLTVSLNPQLGIAVRNSDGVTIPDPTVNSATVSFIPEPASLLLLGLAGLAIRRR